VEDSTNTVALSGASVTDMADNPNAIGAVSNNFAIDTKAPTVSQLILSDRALKVGETSTVTIVFSEAVTGLAPNDFAVSNATVSGVTSSDGVTWTATLTPAANIEASSLVLSVLGSAVTDSVGNANTAAAQSPTFAIDTLAPTVTRMELSSSAIRAGETAALTVTFSEAVTDLTDSDFSVQNGVISGTTSTNGLTWSATFTPALNTESASNSISLPASRVIDAAGNYNASAVSPSYAVDSKVPTINSITVLDPALSHGETTAVSGCSASVSPV